MNLRLGISPLKRPNKRQGQYGIAQKRGIPNRYVAESIRRQWLGHKNQIAVRLKSLCFFEKICVERQRQTRASKKRQASSQ